MNTQNIAFKLPVVHDFLRDLFGPKWGDAWVCGFPGSPGKGSNWRGGRARDLAPGFGDTENIYYAVALVGDDSRNNENFIAAPVVVLDDIGTKADLKEVISALGPAAYMIETSNCNFQFVYRLETPIIDRRLYARILQAVKARGWTDKGSADIVHYMRLPAGVNGKERHGAAPWKVTIAAQTPGQKLSLAALGKVLGLDLENSPSDRGTGTCEQYSRSSSRRGRKSLEAGAIELVRRAVEAVPNDERFEAYDAFISFGQAIHGATRGSYEGLELFRDWWASNPRHGGDAHEAEVKWLSFDPDHAGWQSLLKHVRERDPALADDLHREGAKCAFLDLDPSEDQRVEATKKTADAKETAKVDAEKALLDAMGRRYALVEGEKSIIDLRGSATAPIIRVPREAFTLTNDARRRVGRGRAEVGLGTFCLKTPGVLRVYDRIDMIDPPGSEPAEVLNLWRGFAVPAVAGKWDRIKDLIENTIASGDQALAGFVFDWTARGLQNPLERAGTALCLVGAQGAGKSTVGEILRRIYGLRYSIHAAADNDLVGVFNDRLENRLLFVGDEATFGNDPKIRGKIKALITEAALRIEAKFQSAREVRNRLKIILTSNELAALPIEPGDRRSTIVRVSDNRKGDTAYWRDLYDHLDDEIPAFVHDMLARDLSGFNHRKPHATAAKADMAEATATAFVRFLIDAIDDGGSASGADWMSGAAGGAEDWDSGPVKVRSADLFAEFERWARRGHIRHIPARSVLGQELKALIPDVVAQKPRINGRQERVVVLPSREDCRRAIRKSLGAGDDG